MKAISEFEFPRLSKRMEEDAEKGLFDPNWAISSDKSMAYMSKLIGREVKDTDLVQRTWEEAEEVLSRQ